MQSAPNDESPVGTVPETTNQKRNEQIDVMPWNCNPVPPKGNIHVVAKPG